MNQPPPPLLPDRLGSARLRRLARRLVALERTLLRAAAGLPPERVR